MNAIFQSKASLESAGQDTPASRDRIDQGANRSRRGMFLVAVIVVVVVAALLLGAFTRSIISQARRSRSRLAHRQASLLARAGLDRAVVRLQQDAKFQGETWTVSDAALTGGGEVKIEITTAKTPTGEQRKIRAIATYPRDANWPASVEQTLTVAVSDAGEGP